MPTLTWIGKDKVVNHHHDVPYSVLEKVETFTAPEGTPENSTNNRIIHGDNLSVLKSLLPEFEGRVNCIYIDPPYNTGNEGWVYNDNVNDPRIKKWLGDVVGKEGEDLTRHDKWLCMMYPRLKLLHRLLADDGVIFISIDDNEQANLKLIMDEIFGSRNCVGPIIQNKMNAKNDTINIQKNHEFIIIYGKTGNAESSLLLSKNGYSEKKIIEENGYYYFTNDPITTRGEGGTLNARPNLGYTVYYNPNTKDKIAICDYDITLAKTSNNEAEVYSTDSNLIANGYLPIRPPKVRKKLGAWTWELDKFNKDKNDIVISGKTNSYSVKKRTFVNKEDVISEDGKLVYRYFNSTNSRSILDFSTNDGTNLLNGIMDDSNTFDNPKNVEMLEYLLGLTLNKNAITLDSFAGSGTTAHAVLKLNAEDGGNRQFILCEMMDYADTITAERMRRVMTGYGEGNKKVEGLGGAFDYYQLGEPLFHGEYLNESVGLAKIRQYVAHSENIPLDQRVEDSTVSPSLLGLNPDTAWIFHYERDCETIIDAAFLGTLKYRVNGYAVPAHSIIYADRCVLTIEQLDRFGIRFKKIPRDITRL